jgi:hypothetical protein
MITPMPPLPGNGDPTMLAVSVFSAALGHGETKSMLPNWITSMQPGLQRDMALKGFRPVAARIDGATAMDWLSRVSLMKTQ